MPAAGIQGDRAPALCPDHWPGPQAALDAEALPAAAGSCHGLALMVTEGQMPSNHPPGLSTWKSDWHFAIHVPRGNPHLVS